MGKIEHPFIIPPHIYKELIKPNTCCYIVVTKEEESKVKEAMKHYPEIEVVSYTDRFIHIVADSGKVKFVGSQKIPPILWETQRDSTISTYFNRLTK